MEKNGANCGVRRSVCLKGASRKIDFFWEKALRHIGDRGYVCYVGNATHRTGKPQVYKRGKTWIP